MTIARIENGSVVEQRDLTLEQVPEHKRSQWLPVEGEAPAYDPRTHTRTGPVLEVQADKVVRVWQVASKSIGEIQAAFADAIQAHVDAVAHVRGYADGVACASYVASAIPSWNAEATAFVNWRDNVWIHSYTELAKVQAGTRPLPTIAEMIAELPLIVWPE